MAADLTEDRDLALQLHKVLSEIDPARWRDEMAAVLKPRLTDPNAAAHERVYRTLRHFSGYNVTAY